MQKWYLQFCTVGISRTSSDFTVQNALCLVCTVIRWFYSVQLSQARLPFSYFHIISMLYECHFTVHFSFFPLGTVVSQNTLNFPTVYFVIFQFCTVILQRPKFPYGVFRYLPILHRNSLKTQISLRCNSRSSLFCTVSRPATSKPYGANTAISTSHRNHLTVIKFFLYFLMFSPLNHNQKCVILP